MTTWTWSGYSMLGILFRNVFPKRKLGTLWKRAADWHWSCGMDDLAYGKPINETVKTRVPEAIKTTAREIDWKAGSAEPIHKRWHIYNWACLGRPKGDSRLFFWFSAIQLVHVCLVSYRGQLIAEVFSMSMDVARGNGNVHSRTRHMMMMMIMTMIFTTIYLIKYVICTRRLMWLLIPF